MFRITTRKTGKTTELLIDGELTNECVGVLEGFCLGGQRENAPGEVCLRDVTAVDQAGQDLILRLERAGIPVRGIGIFTSYLIDQLHRKHNAPAKAHK